MKKVIVGYLFKLLMLLAVASVAFGPLQASAMEKPRGVKLIKTSECRIDYERSTYWTGRAEDAILQITWLVKQLPKKCLEDKCVFRNIKRFYFTRVSSTRFLEEFQDNPQLWQLGVHVSTAMKDCRLEVYTERSGRKMCIGSNKAHVTGEGNNNTVDVQQSGCNNNATIVIVGDNNEVVVIQDGGDNALVEIYDSNTDHLVDQT